MQIAIYVHCYISPGHGVCTKVYFTSLGPSNFLLFFTQFQNKEYHWIPRVLPHLVIGLTKSESL